uniref:Selenoprotein F n=1 Tax=Otus sunia TaxID=257818 RepID=A0A8C8B607_9STRI
MAAAAELTALGRCWFWLLVGLQAHNSSDSWSIIIQSCLLLSPYSSLNTEISVYGAQLSSEACRELGFSSNLLCSSCNLLGQFNLNQLDPFCRQCCQEEAQLETRKLYAGAVLEVCG